MNRSRREEWLRWGLTLLIPLVLSGVAAWYALDKTTAVIQVQIAALKESVDARNLEQDRRITELHDDMNRRLEARR